MPLFVTADGLGVQVPALAPKRRLTIDSRVLRLMRCQTWERYQELGFTLATIAKAFGLSLSTIKADLRYLSDERAADASIDFGDDA